MVRGGDVGESTQFGRRRPRDPDMADPSMSTNFDDGSGTSRGKGAQKKREFNNDEQELGTTPTPITQSNII